MRADHRHRVTKWPVQAKVTVAVLVALFIALLAAAPTPGMQVVAVPAATDTAPPTTVSKPAPVSTSVAVAPTSTSTTPTPTTAPESQATAQLVALQIDDHRAAPVGYSRDLFPTWLDLDGNGCDARDDTLVAEAITFLQLSGCTVVGGEWLSMYDNVTVDDPALLDVDHLIPVAEAWRSGAQAWDAERRARFANDLSDPDHLIAVTAATNRSKGDSPPNEWRPPVEASWCRYATAWVTVKSNWNLTATTPERDALGQMLSRC